MHGRSGNADGSSRTGGRSVARIVATIGLLAGLGFAVIVPPLGGYDETVHFLRAYQVSQGQLVATRHGKQLGGSMPVSIQHDLSQLLVQLDQVVTHGPHAPSNPATYLRRIGDPAARGRSSFVEFPSAAVYSPVSYAPASLLIALGRAFGASTLLLIYLGRLGSLLGTIGLLGLAARRMPTRAAALATIALLPVTVVQAAMLSADGVTLALTLLVLALALRLAATESDAVSRAQLVELTLATVALGFAKPPYILIALAFAIPWRRHAPRVRRAIVGAVVGGFAATAAWGAYAAKVYVAPVLPKSLAPGGVQPFAAYTNVDPHRQERYMLHHPWRFAHAVGNTVSTYGTHLLREAVAQVPLWLLPGAFAAIAIIVLGASLCASEPSDALDLSWRSRAFLVGIAGVTFVGLMALAYTGWNAVGSPRVEAFQGRYLLPLIPLLVVAIPVPRVAARLERAASDAIVGSGMAALLAAVGIALWIHLY